MTRQHYFIYVESCIYSIRKTSSLFFFQTKLSSFIYKSTLNHYILFVKCLSVNPSENQRHVYEEGEEAPWDIQIFLTRDQTRWFVVVMAAITNADISTGSFRKLWNKRSKQLTISSLAYTAKWRGEMDGCHIVWLFKDFFNVGMTERSSKDGMSHGFPVSQCLANLDWVVIKHSIT